MHLTSKTELLSVSVLTSRSLKINRPWTPLSNSWWNMTPILTILTLLTRHLSSSFTPQDCKKSLKLWEQRARTLTKWAKKASVLSRLPLCEEMTLKSRGSIHLVQISMRSIIREGTCFTSRSTLQVQLQMQPSRQSSSSLILEWMSISSMNVVVFLFTTPLSRWRVTLTPLQLILLRLFRVFALSRTFKLRLLTSGTRLLYTMQLSTVLQSAHSTSCSAVPN